MRRYIGVLSTLFLLLMAVPVAQAGYTRLPGAYEFVPQTGSDFAMRVLTSAGATAFTIATDGTVTISSMSVTSAIAVFPVTVSIDDGSGDSPILRLRDGDDKDLSLQKLTAGKAQILNTEGAIEIGPSNDPDDVIELSTTSDVPMIGTEGACDLAIKASGGDLILGGSDGATNNESINLDFEGTSNNVVVTTATGVTDFDFGTINVGTDALDVSDGNITNVGSIGADSLVADGSALALGGGTETVAIDSSDWDIGTSGIMTGIGAITADGLFTGSLGLTITGAVVSLNASSNFAVNIATGSSSGAVSIGGNSNTVAVNSSDWDINTTGDMSGIGTFGSDGDMDLSATGGSTTDGDFTVAGYADFNGSVEIDGALQADAAVTLGDGGDAFSVASTGVDITSGGAVSNVTTFASSGDMDLSATGGTTDDGDLTVAGYADFNGTVEFDGAIQADAAITLGDGGDNFSIASNGIDISTGGNISNAGTVGCGKITSSYVSTSGAVYAASGVLTSEATLDVTRGGSGAGTFTDGGILLGSGAGAFTALGAAANGQIPIGDGTTDPVLATITGTANRVTVTNGAGTITLSGPQDLASTSDVTFDGLTLSGCSTGGAVYVTSGEMTSEANLDVTRGGTGVGSLTEGGVLIGGGTGDITASAVLTNGQLLIGDGTTAPAVATLTGTANQVTVTNGAGTITLSTPQSIATSSDVTFDGLTLSGLATDGAVYSTSGELTSEAYLDVTRGGTGVGSLTEGGLLCGGGTGDITALGAAANGQIPIGDGTTAPTLATITGTANQITVTNGAGTITLSTPQSIATTSTPTFGDITISDLTVDGAVRCVSGELTSEAQVAVARGGTGLASGTSGGVLAYTAAGTLTSSGALAQYAPVIGGGAGAAPSTITAGTDTQALFGATGSAPSFRAIGDDDVPPALTLSGSTIENSPIGASTANTGRFTTCTATSKFSGSEVENFGNVSIDAVNGEANSEVYVQNSAETYTANLNVDGDLLVSGHRNSLVRTVKDVQYVDMDFAYAGGQGCHYLANAKATKVLHIPLDLVVGEEITGYALVGALMATTNTSEVDCSMYSVTKAAGTPSPQLVANTAMTQVDTGSDVALDNGATFAAVTAAADTSYYLAVTVSTGADAGCKFYLSHAEYTVNAK